jgi:hypothetical protein
MCLIFSIFEFGAGDDIGENTILIMWMNLIRRIHKI